MLDEEATVMHWSVKGWQRQRNSGERLSCRIWWRTYDGVQEETQEECLRGNV